MSGFILEVGEVWLWATAGHYLEDVAKLNRKGLIKQCRFLDGFGDKPATKEGLPVSITVCPGWTKYRSETGIDIGFLVLRTLYSDGLRANGIVPMEFATWRYQLSIEFDGYCLCGVIEQFVHDYGAGWRIGNTFFPVVATDEPPATVKKEFPRFLWEDSAIQRLEIHPGNEWRSYLWLQEDAYRTAQILDFRFAVWLGQYRADSRRLPSDCLWAHVRGGNSPMPRTQEPIRDPAVVLMA
jgi:hypothetical protein